MYACGWVSRCTAHAANSRTMRRLRLLCVRMREKAALLG